MRGPFATRRRSETALPVLVLLALAVGPQPAHAASLLDDCQDGRIDGTYSQADYRRALRNIPSDFDQYTDCRRVIRRAQLAAAGGGSDPGAQSGATAGVWIAGNGGAWQRAE